MVQTILTDIEGTTSSIGFVRDVLFPYAAKELPRFVRKHAGDTAVRELIRASAIQAGLRDTDLDAVIAQLLAWMEDDVKTTPLKALQGMVWAAGYRRGDYRAHVYEDASRNLRRWFEQGLSLHVYSSGSVQAQELFFRYSDRGDLRPLFSGHFDTRVGAKNVAASYRAIARILATPPSEMLFLSDAREELDAARRAGMHTCWLRRPAETPDRMKHPDTPGHVTARSFDDIAIPR